MPDSLYIVRHGIALPHGTPGMPDSQRPLTPRGEARVHEIGKALRRLDMGVNTLVTSPLPRALRTAEILAEELHLDARPEVFDGLSAGAPARAVRDWLSTRPEACLMMVGHNPDLNDLIALLAGFAGGTPPFELRKGGVAALSTAHGGGYQLDWLATPRLLRRLAG